jgi:IS4 transposase
MEFSGAFSLFGLHHAHPSDFRQGKRLGQQDRLLVWPKPWLWQRPPYLSKSIWKLIPRQLSVRVVRSTLAVPGFRSQPVTLVTTLLDAQAHPAEELARLYARRWQIELCFRDIKTSHGHGSAQM